MSTLTNYIKSILAHKSDKICVKTIGGSEISYLKLSERVSHLSNQLLNIDRNINQRLVGIAINQSIDWLVADFSVINLSTVSLPVPLEFSDEQLSFLLKNVDYCLVNDVKTSERIQKILPNLTQININGEVKHIGLVAEHPPWKYLHEQGVIKVIHTSGTTSHPKGVLIKDHAVAILLTTLVDLHKNLESLNYLSLVPFSLLIEQVLGIYLPLITGGSVTLLPVHVLPFGTQNNHAKIYLNFLKEAQPNFIYMPPRLIEETHNLLISGTSVSELFLRQIPHIITGGAKINKNLLEELENFGVIIYEAYGLSEHSSIVTINTHHSRQVGSPGKFLPYVDYRIEEGELLIKSPTLSPGYLSKDSTSCDVTKDGFLRTGDIVELDSAGFLYVLGRKKHVIILSNARNVCPEWVEAAYKKCNSIADIIVMGEGMESLWAIVLPASSNITEDTIKKEMKYVEKTLSFYATVNQFIIYPDYYSFKSKYYTVTGRPRRNAISEDFKSCFANAIKIR